ncbi:hypothetical protein, partial [Streptomyces sp. SID5770]|uniref:hypothetical protein n=1 Tax=Streptomyces sp. SID5770 TaxID=2690308 RepID=UPI001F3235CF
MVATTGADGVVRLWDPSLLRPVRTLPGHSNGYALCDLDLDGRSLVATAVAGLERVVSGPSREVVPQGLLPGGRREVRAQAFRVAGGW